MLQFLKIFGRASVCPPEVRRVGWLGWTPRRVVEWVPSKQFLKSDFHSRPARLRVYQRRFSLGRDRRPALPPFSVGKIGNWYCNLRIRDGLHTMSVLIEQTGILV